MQTWKILVAHSIWVCCTRNESLRNPAGYTELCNSALWWDSRPSKVQYWVLSPFQSDAGTQLGCTCWLHFVDRYKSPAIKVRAAKQTTTRLLISRGNYLAWSLRRPFSKEKQVGCQSCLHSCLEFNMSHATQRCFAKGTGKGNIRWVRWTRLPLCFPNSSQSFLPSSFSLIMFANPTVFLNAC